MKLSTLPLILQINFDSHLYNAGERASLPPWGMSRDETRQMWVFAVVAWLYLIFKFFFLILQTFIWRCEHISINNSVLWAYFYVCTAFYFSGIAHVHTEDDTLNDK